MSYGVTRHFPGYPSRISRGETRGLQRVNIGVEPIVVKVIAEGKAASS